jgi:hypothetical protein
MSSRRPLNPTEIQEIENLITKTHEAPINPDTFIPWETPPEDSYLYMPNKLFSLHGHPLFETLTPQQKTELAKREVAQVMYSYAWSEGLACLFFYSFLVSLKDSVSAEYRYLLIEIFEETCHQQMFSKGVQKLGVTTVPARNLHRFAGWFATRFLPPDVLFMSVLSIEIVTEMYGTALMDDPDVYPVLRKISELHKIEETRHMYFGELLLKRHTEHAGVFRRTMYSILVCVNLYFMRTLYVRKSILQDIGLDPKVYYKPAYDGLKKKFAEHCLAKAIGFVEEWNGFNWFSRFFWRALLSAKV